MKLLYDFIISKIKIVIGLILVLAIFYIVFIVLANNQESNYLNVIKDVLGGMSFALSISLALSLNINVANYKADQQYFVEGDLHQHTSDSTKTVEVAEKNEVLKTINKIVNDTSKLSSILNLDNISKPMGFVPLNTQRDIIYNERNFLNHIDSLRNKLTDGALTIKDENFVKILNESIPICQDIKKEYNDLYKASQSPLLNQISTYRNKTVENLNSLVAKLKEKNEALKQNK